MLRFVLAIISLVGLIGSIESIDYCTANLCPAGVPHVGCNPPALTVDRTASEDPQRWYRSLPVFSRASSIFTTVVALRSPMVLSVRSGLLVAWLHCSGMPSWPPWLVIMLAPAH
uniref:Laminin N-terminal domain-containing protein n=1 Tax=Anopheles albimanus TaxID=7167 RepID=A0A8W7K8Q9_ANOAL